jgi:hypothetical protein
MTVYIANENGDWWEYVKDSVLYVIDTDNPEITQAMRDQDMEIGGDKFEKFIWNNGSAIDIAKGAYKWD